MLRIAVAMQLLLSVVDGQLCSSVFCWSVYLPARWQRVWTVCSDSKFEAPALIATACSLYGIAVGFIMQSVIDFAIRLAPSIGKRV